MKKLLIMLMVVAMASFLFVGCIPTTPDVDEDDEEPLPTPPPATVAPIITSVPDIVGGYINKANAADGIVVNGTAPTYSEVKVYINGLTAGTGDTEANGVFQVVVAKADLIKAVKTDGAKVLYATATEAGLAESASSNVKTFTLDTVAPKISSSKAKAGTAGTDEVDADVDETVVGTTALSVGPTMETEADVVDGTWTINVNAATGTSNVSITDPNGIITWYTSGNADNFAEGAPIPGVSFTLHGTLAPGQCSQIVCTAQADAVDAVPGYVDVTFSEAVTGASILVSPAGTGVWTAFCANLTLKPTATVRSATVARLTEFAFVPLRLVVGKSYSVICSGISDLAGNTISSTAPSTSIGVVLP